MLCEQVLLFGCTIASMYELKVKSTLLYMCTLYVQQAKFDYNRYIYTFDDDMFSLPCL